MFTYCLAHSSSNYFTNVVDGNCSPLHLRKPFSETSLKHFRTACVQIAFKQASTNQSNNQNRSQKFPHGDVNTLINLKFLLLKVVLQATEIQGVSKVLQYLFILLTNAAAF